MIDGFWSRIEAVLEAKSLLKHPFYQAWTRGDLTRDDLADYARQYYQQEARFPRYLSAVHSNCPELKARQTILENMTHEESAADNHPELWLGFAEAIGASRESVLRAAPHAGTSRCIESFTRLSRGDWRTGLAALYAYEAQQPAVADAKISGLRERYGVSSEPALKFFKVHREMDAWHSASEKTILAEEIRKDPSVAVEIESAVSEACDALNALLDGVCEARGIACAV